MKIWTDYTTMESDMIIVRAETGGGWPGAPIPVPDVKIPGVGRGGVGRGGPINQSRQSSDCVSLPTNDTGTYCLMTGFHTRDTSPDLAEGAGVSHAHTRKQPG